MNHQVQNLLAAHSEGLIDQLPSDVLSLSKRLEVIDGHIRRARSDFGTTHKDSPVSKAKAASVTQLIEGTGDVNVETIAGSILEAKRTEELAQTFLDILDRARGRLEGKLLAAVSEGADDVIVGLQSALEGLFRDVRRDAKALDGIELDPAVVLSAGDSRQRNAYNALNQANDRYNRMRECFGALAQLRKRRSADRDGYFGIFQDPEKWAGTPTDAAARVIALATSDAHCWFPTVDQLNARVARWQQETGPQRHRLRKQIARAEAIEVGVE